MTDISLIPITTDPVQMEKYTKHELAREAFLAWEHMYPLWGYHLPWIGYFAMQDATVVGLGGFKGRPKNATVELAYGTLPEFEGKGIAQKICRLLVSMALQEAPELRITARTLPENNASAQILKKTGFLLLGDVEDPDDGIVWEWEWQKESLT